jgi:hypothetical protein
MRLLTLLVIAFTTCVLSATASAQVINGCIKNNGVLKIVGAPEDCAGNETHISWNAQGPPGPDASLRVVDGSGAEVGSLVEDARANLGIFMVFLESSGVIVPLSSGGSLALNNISQPIYFTLPGCTGAAYAFGLGAAGRLRADPDSGRLFAAETTEETNVSVESLLGSGCVARPGHVLSVAVPATEVTPADLGLNLPLPRPLYVDLPPQ